MVTPDENQAGSSWAKRQISSVLSLRDNHIIKNAASLYGSTIITSALGFIYWLVAARILSARSVGIGVAVQSAAQFMALICVFGLGTLTIGELAKDKSAARSLILTTAAAVAVVSLIVSVGVGFALESASETLRSGLEGPLRLSIFAMLTCVSTVALLIDDSTIGLLRGELQLRRNAIFAASKLALLPILVYTWDAKSGGQLIVAWLAGVSISLVVTSIELAKATKGQSSHLDIKNLFDKRHLITHHHWLNVSLIAPQYIWPIIVATVIGARETAAFNAAWMTFSFINVIPSHLSIVLFSLEPGDELALRKQVRISMRICAILSGASAPFFLIFSYIILGIFNVGYRIATPALMIMGFITLPNAIKVHYVAIRRVRGQMSIAASRTTAATALEVALAVAGAYVHGLTGLAGGLLVANLVELALFSPMVIEVLRKDAQSPS